MRMFLVWLGTEPGFIVGEVLTYDPATHLMELRGKNGETRAIVFNPKGRYNRTDYRLVKETADA